VLPTQIYFGAATASYLITPKYNLRFELGRPGAKDITPLGIRTTVQVTFGLRRTSGYLS